MSALHQDPPEEHSLQARVGSCHTPGHGPASEEEVSPIQPSDPQTAWLCLLGAGHLSFVTGGFVVSIITIKAYSSSRKPRSL
jgi:hypothetical protein